MEAFLSEVAEAVGAFLGRPGEEISPHLTASRDTSRGDVALPCFKLAGQLGRSGKDAAPALAREIAAGLHTGGGVIAGAEAAGPYVNFRIEPALIARRTLEPLWAARRWGASEVGRGKTVVIDFSSPNIAKPFHLGHLRSTVIGWSLRQIFRALGYSVVGVNHLGDWGTQFGFMIVAWKQWGKEGQARIDKGERDVDVFVDLYTRVNKAAKEDPAVREQARAEFRKLEEGDAEARKLWHFFVDRSKREFARIYQVLGITHESDAGESFYEDKMPGALERLQTSGLLEPGLTRREQALEAVERARAKLAGTEAQLAQLEADRAAEADPKKQQKLDARREKLQGQLPAQREKLAELEAKVPAEEDGKRPLGVKLTGDGPSFCMLVKGDGTTTYTTRDIAAALYRGATYQPERMIYVVGNEQRDHFSSWFQVVERLGVPWAKGLAHVGFGRYLGMSTRGGSAVFLEEVLERARVKAREAADRATKKVELSDEDKEHVARAIGVGAVKFFDLKAERIKNIDLRLPTEQTPDEPQPAGDDEDEGEGEAPAQLQTSKIDWDRLLDLKGETGPYLQFAYARLSGILRRHEGGAPGVPVDWSLLCEPETLDLIKVLGEWPGTVAQAAERLEPSVIARYLIQVAAVTHVCLDRHRVLDALPTDEQAARGVTPEALRAARILLVACARKTIGEALELLGIEALEQM